MRAIEILMEEHRVIERVLNSLEEAILRMEKGQALRRDFFLDVLDFIQGFADGCHHRKEEGVLFEAMVETGMPREGGPIAVMMMEHERGRSLTQAMREAIQRMLDGDTSARDALKENAMSYIRLLRDHIAKEDGILFPMAAQVIPSDKYSQLLHDYQVVEEQDNAINRCQKYPQLADQLDQEFSNKF